MVARWPPEWARRGRSAAAHGPVGDQHVDPVLLGPVAGQQAQLALGAGRLADPRELAAEPLDDHPDPSSNRRLAASTRSSCSSSSRLRARRAGWPPRRPRPGARGRSPARGRGPRPGSARRPRRPPSPLFAQAPTRCRAGRRRPAGPAARRPAAARPAPSPARPAARPARPARAAGRPGGSRSRSGAAGQGQLGVGRAEGAVQLAQLGARRAPARPAPAGRPRPAPARAGLGDLALEVAQAQDGVEHVHRPLPGVATAMAASRAPARRRAGPPRS